MANKLTISAVGLLSLLAVGAFAQTATTTPVGFISYTIKAGTVAAPSTTSVFFGLTDSATITGLPSGKVSTVGTNTITVTGAGWTPSGLANAAIPYLVRITSGAAEGTTWEISANTADVLTVKNNSVVLSSLGVVAGTDTFEILTADTFGTLFGTSLPVQGTPAASGKLAGGPTSAQADVVSVWNGSVWLPFWFNTTLNTWVQGTSSTNRNDYVIRPDAGVLIVRKGDVVALTLVGRAPASSLRARYLNSGTSFVGLFPVTSTLADLKLQLLPGWVGLASTGGTSSTSIDRVSVWNGSQWLTFYYDTTPAAPQWRLTTNGTARDTYAVQTPDRPIMVQKAGATSGSSFIAQVKPY